MSTQVNILMVDDQPAKLLSYETILSSLGENLIRAGSGREALDHLLKTEVAVVLMDVCMPDVDGFELASMIRQHPRFQKTAIILISAIHLTDLDRIKGYEAGAVDYVPVPVVPEILRAKVVVFADLYRKTQQLEQLNLQLEQRVMERTADLEALAARLREADRRKDQFLATLAHELRNPLAPIATAAKILQARPLRAQEIIERQTAHLTRLVDDLLDLSRISRNRLELRKERTELSVVIAAALETSRPVIELAGHQLTVSLPAAPVYLEADVVRLSQVFTNLLNNSAKFTNAGGLISLIAEAGSDTVEVRIKDTGIGILPEHLPHLSEPFYQLDSSLERSHGGLGIGLTLVWQLVEMHGGSVVAHSEGKGTGSEFVVRLPVAKPAQAREDVPPATASENIETGMRILVVDDNRDSADALVLILQLEGHVAEAVYSGVEALAYAELNRPEAILLDIGMPQLNGYQVAQQIRKQPWATNLLLVAQTGWGQDEDVRQCREAGFNCHFTKPIDFQKLRDFFAQARAQIAADR